MQVVSIHLKAYRTWLVFCWRRASTMASAAWTASSRVMLVESSRTESSQFAASLERAGVAVALVAGAEVGDDLLRLYNGLAVFAAELIVAAEAPDFRSSVKKDLDLSMGKDNGADVAAFHDDATGFGKLLLQADHPGANDGKDADF